MLATPVYAKEVLPGDKWRIKPIVRVRALPFERSLMGNYSVQLAWFFEPDTNLYGWMDNNMQISAEYLSSAPLHTFQFGGDSPISSSYFGNSLNNAGTLLNYLYFPIDFNPKKLVSNTDTEDAQSIQVDARRALTYWDIIRNYYVNRQLPTAPFVTTIPYTSSEPPIGTFSYYSMPLESLDLFFLKLRGAIYGVNLSSDIGSVISTMNTSQKSNISALFDSFLNGNYRAGAFSRDRMTTNQGLFCVNYRSDVYTRVMSNDTGFNATISISDVDSEGNETTPHISMNGVIGASRMQAFINNMDITGGRFSDWMRFRYGVNVGRQTDRPYLLSVETIPLRIQDMRTTSPARTVSSSSSSNYTPAATQVGYIDFGGKVNKISFNSSCSGTLMCIASIIPNVHYSQGVEQEVLATKFMDLYQPEFSNISFQDMPRVVFDITPDSSVTLSSGTPGTTTYFNFLPLSSQGRNIAWWHYMTDVNRSYSHLAAGGSMDEWILNRSFKRTSITGATNNETIRLDYGFTTYGFPDSSDYVFAEARPDSQNFIFQMSLDCQVRRPIPKFNLPKVY